MSFVFEIVFIYFLLKVFEYKFYEWDNFGMKHINAGGKVSLTVYTTEYLIVNNWRHRNYEAEQHFETIRRILQFKYVGLIIIQYIETQVSFKIKLANYKYYVLEKDSEFWEPL